MNDQDSPPIPEDFKIRIRSLVNAIKDGTVLCSVACEAPLTSVTFKQVDGLAAKVIVGPDSDDQIPIRVVKEKKADTFRIRDLSVVESRFGIPIGLVQGDLFFTEFESASGPLYEDKDNACHREFELAYSTEDSQENSTSSVANWELDSEDKQLLHIRLESDGMLLTDFVIVEVDNVPQLVKLSLENDSGSKGLMLGKAKLENWGDHSTFVTVRPVNPQDAWLIPTDVISEIESSHDLRRFTLGCNSEFHVVDSTEASAMWFLECIASEVVDE